MAPKPSSGIRVFRLGPKGLERGQEARVRWMYAVWLEDADLPPALLERLEKGDTLKPREIEHWISALPRSRLIDGPREIRSAARNDAGLRRALQLGRLSVRGEGSPGRVPKT